MELLRNITSAERDTLLTSDNIITPCFFWGTWKSECSEKKVDQKRDYVSFDLDENTIFFFDYFLQLLNEKNKTNWKKDFFAKLKLLAQSLNLVCISVDNPEEFILYYILQSHGGAEHFICNNFLETASNTTKKAYKDLPFIPRNTRQVHNIVEFLFKSAGYYATMTQNKDIVIMSSYNFFEQEIELEITLKKTVSFVCKN